jgi:hypothetical protein
MQIDPFSDAKVLDSWRKNAEPSSDGKASLNHFHRGAQRTGLLMIARLS